MTHLEFIGHVLSGSGISPTDVRVKAVVDAREPTNAAEVKSFQFSTKPLPWETSYGNFSRPFNSTIVLFGQVCTPLVEITTTFRESPDQNRKSLKTQRVYPFVL